MVHPVRAVLDVAAQIEIKSKAWKRSTTFYFQVREPDGFNRVARGKNRVSQTGIESGTQGWEGSFRACKHGFQPE